MQNCTSDGNPWTSTATGFPLAPTEPILTKQKREGHEPFRLKEKDINGSRSGQSLPSSQGKHPPIKAFLRAFLIIQGKKKALRTSIL